MSGLIIKRHSQITEAVEMSDHCFIFNNKNLLLTKEDRRLPETKEVISLLPHLTNVLEVTFDNKAVLTAHYCGDIDTTPFRSISLPSSRSVLDKDLLPMLSYAYHMYNWNKSTQFCGACGNPTVLSDLEVAKNCPNCHEVNYPRISPAMIAGVVRGNELLMVKSRLYKSPYFSIVAGYLEPGETLEQCVAREVNEETGITVKNITYFGNQPWGWSGSVMVGFTAEYQSGEISIDESEIIEADWFPLNKLPERHPGKSISKDIIDHLIRSSHT
ncbi:NAD(+) diphosphatase [Chitinispirillales bacterium ANBcel5]|uniref:NAD(+) diphosphatase n=1 Tax=Cellulosispirillum alkaliphilum TaxID=3039283 RepID=UPI002A52F9BF|nr:NAD(+) diphosphatase [Chitinispirillales bacterium ANBcel5]